ncbi:MAG TPA: RNA polymerase sigma factor [Planctomycetota bacterium]
MKTSAFTAGWAERLREPLGKFIYGFVRDRHVAEDLEQETLLKVVRNLHRYRAQAALKTWVFSIARNLCLDHLRSAGRTRLRLIGTLDPSEIETPDVPDARAETEESRARVAEALSGLSPDARELLILRNYLGLSYREIARRRGVAAAGIGTRLLRARRGLLKKLRRESCG